MALALSDLLATPLPPGTKGLPAAAAGLAVGEIGPKGWNLLAGDIPFPAAVLRGSALAGNIAAMQAWIARSGVSLAPHGKTTMCPQLFDRQLDSGAWAITVANVAQATLCHAIGVPRVLIANEVVGATEVAMLAQLCAARPETATYVLVDSVAGAEGLQAGFAAVPDAPPANVLVELGFAGGRCGVRSVAEGLAVARAVAGMDRLRLCGVEGYEGLFDSGDPVADAATVNAYLDDLVALLDQAGAAGLFAPGEVLLSAGGSAYYDLVARIAARPLATAPRIVVRSGCYVTQDSGFYRRALAEVAAREGEAAPRLANALEVWARVLSVPEPGRAILSAGKRDLSFDIDLPFPERWFRPGRHDAPQPIAGWRIAKLSDQHAFALSDPTDAQATPLAVGDLVALGISHPCTTFDKWPVLLEVDDAYAVVGALRTFF